MLIKIRINAYQDSYSSYSDEEYGPWSEDITTEIQSVSIVNDKDYFDLIIENDFDTTADCYLVYALYSGGDSFGSSSGNIEYIKLFKTLDEAQLFKDDLELLEKYASSNFKQKEFIPKLFENVDTKYDFNRSFEYFGEKFYLPWGGYFEALEDIGIIELNFVDTK